MLGSLFVSALEQEVVIPDTTPPVIRLSGSATVQIVQTVESGAYVDAGRIQSFSCEGTIGIKCTVKRIYYQYRSTVITNKMRQIKDSNSMEVVIQICR